MRAAGRAGCRVVLVASACCRATAWIRCAACRAVVGRGGRGGRACVRARARGARPATRSPFSRHDGMHAAAGNQPVRLHACSSRGQYSGAHSVASRRAGDDKMATEPFGLNYPHILRCRRLTAATTTTSEIGVLRCTSAPIVWRRLCTVNHRCSRLPGDGLVDRAIDN
uniref:Uncharacterized protein n=1 Tax=Oryza sativa subsp. japonica TaxID=39947 RepID=Q6ZH76_ORYSJ|nr:hypothetical protein [Oryza sativa Japonica Group]BAD16896.1 hypothetical protein [Oryza sativa Japonica Group]